MLGGLTKEEIDYGFDSCRITKTRPDDLDRENLAMIRRELLNELGQVEGGEKADWIDWDYSGPQFVRAVGEYRSGRLWR